MPDVGLTTATEPLDPSYRVVIKYSVEVEGLPVYQESYDLEQLKKELKEDEAKFAQLWLRRVKCVVAARDQPMFSARVTHCIGTGAEELPEDKNA